jgi:putative peptidoglycan lipid II flippase
MAEAKTDLELSRLLGTVMGWVGILSLAAAVVFALGSPTLLRWTSNFDSETVDLTVTYCWLLTPFVCLTTLSAAVKAACELKQHFTGITWTPVLRAGIVIAVTWATLDSLGPMSLPAGLVSGEAAQLLFWLFLLWRSGIKPLPNLAKHPKLTKLSRHVLWLLGGEALVALNLVVDKIFASQLTEGTVSILEYADRARVIPQTLLHASLAMVAFAAWSKFWAGNDQEKAHESMDRSLHWVLALSAPVIAGMFIGREVLCHVLFERGAFGSSDREQTAIVLGGYLLGVVPNLMAILMVRIHVLQQHFSQIFLLGFVSMSLNAGLNVLLIPHHGLLGIAFSTSITVTLVTLGYLYRLPKAIQPAKWTTGWIAFGAALLCATGFEYFAPARHFTDGSLWAAATCCILILVWAFRYSPSPTEVAE